MVSKNPTAKLLQNHMVKWLLQSIQIHGPMAKKTTPCSRCLEVFLGNLQRVPHNKPQSESNHKIILRHAFDPLPNGKQEAPATGAKVPPRKKKNTFQNWFGCNTFLWGMKWLKLLPDSEENRKDVWGFWTSGSASQNAGTVCWIFRQTIQ